MQKIVKLSIFTTQYHLELSSHSVCVLCVWNVNELLLVCPMNLKQVNQNLSETLETIFNNIKS